MTTRKQSVDQQKNKLTKGKEKHANMQLREAFIVGKQEKCVMFLVSKAINFCRLCGLSNCSHLCNNKFSQKQQMDAAAIPMG
jgi:hypothetical protein